MSEPVGARPGERWDGSELPGVIDVFPGAFPGMGESR
jgi:hypothetical protein